MPRIESPTLVHIASDKRGLELRGDHTLWQCAFVHACWNKFDNHTTMRMSPFELVFGRRYSGKVVSFGEVVLLLHRKGPDVKVGFQWILGVSFTKIDGDDLQWLRPVDL